MERQIRLRPELDDTLAVRLAGRATEELVFGVASTGGHNDLVQATEPARHMVREWGMSDRLGHIAWGAQGPVFLGEELSHTRDYSDETARVIDDEVTRILDQQADRAASELARHRPALDAVATALLQHETLDATDIAPHHPQRLPSSRPRWPTFHVANILGDDGTAPVSR